MTDPDMQLQASLRAHQLSVTTSRQTVFRALHHSHAPLTMAELIAACPAIDRASVYRTVTLFETLGICQRVQFGWKYKIELSDQFEEHHHHMSCTNCGRTIELPEDRALEARLQELALAQGFTPSEHQIEIRGLCETCAAAPAV